jgi:hypothetical protein
MSLISSFRNNYNIHVNTINNNNDNNTQLNAEITPNTRRLQKINVIIDKNDNTKNVYWDEFGPTPTLYEYFPTKPNSIYANKHSRVCKPRMEGIQIHINNINNNTNTNNHYTNQNHYDNTKIEERMNVDKHDFSDKQNNIIDYQALIPDLKFNNSNKAYNLRPNNSIQYSPIDSPERINCDDDTIGIIQASSLECNKAKYYYHGRYRNYYCSMNIDDGEEEAMCEKMRKVKINEHNQLFYDIQKCVSDSVAERFTSNLNNNNTTNNINEYHYSPIVQNTMGSSHIDNNTDLFENDDEELKLTTSKCRKRPLLVDKDMRQAKKPSGQPDSNMNNSRHHINYLNLNNTNAISNTNTQIKLTASSLNNHSTGFAKSTACIRPNKIVPYVNLENTRHRTSLLQFEGNRPKATTSILQQLNINLEYK